jgi:hypothetical protein
LRSRFRVGDHTQGFDTSSSAPTTTTGQTGDILFGGVIPGLVKVTATPPGLKGPMGTVSVTVHAGATTVLILRPTP